MHILQTIATFASRTFAVWIIVFSGLAVLFPDVFAPLAGYTVPLLAVVMLGMGLTLRFADFTVVARRPIPLLTGVVTQFVVMPALAWGVATLLGLPAEVALGLILLGSVPGGTASNVVAYLARGDVAVSVAMTSISTIAAILVTPFLVLFYGGHLLPVDTGAMVLSIAQVVLLPVLAGLVLRALMPRVIERATPVVPMVSVVAVVVICSGVVGASVETLLAGGLLVIAAVMVHNLIGLAIGYGVAKLMGMSEAQRRSISFEIGIQNSGLASTLATAHFGPAAALPGAIAAVWANISGPLLSTFWGSRPPQDEFPATTTAAPAAEPGGDLPPRAS
ncbi:BASS family bile acid:Na+ symporter [Lipingzhangella halophila]|uniref:BASS family bile acid:Na+ symporter n=1 Tax=Lipingzhangella halophila TaxID=1783352 RepID=A0A7W7RJ55_9ACTN|nr:bile acid:sodium symporter family protein [Lipingzhangella halophila]MBB4932959.1 BASS family bile acid:Na+ symporter [Lipingzhangella halophila]